MSAKYASIVVVCLGVVGLLIPLFLPPAPVLPNWAAFLPYVIFGAALFMAKSPEDSRFLLVIILVAVGGGTWAYWDSMRFNMAFSWQAFGLVSRYVPLFQMAVALPAVGYARWRYRGCQREGGQSHS